MPIQKPTHQIISDGEWDTIFIPASELGRLRPEHFRDIVFIGSRTGGGTAFKVEEVYESDGASQETPDLIISRVRDEAWQVTLEVFERVADLLFGMDVQVAQQSETAKRGTGV